MKKSVLFKILLILILVSILSIIAIFYEKVGPTNGNNDIVNFSVNKGDTYYSVADKLYEQGLINSTKWFKIYVKIFNPKDLKQGMYDLSNSMGIKNIVKTLENDSYNQDITLTFTEGLNMRYVATLIENNTNNKADDLYGLLKDKDYLNTLIEKYWFITDVILDSKIYYSLEGYLFPDTYQFASKDVDIKEIIEKLLDNTEKKLESIKEDITKSEYTVHELLTLASIIEKEAGNANDRSKVSAVFYNRINTEGETLGSDVTAYYGAMMDDWSNGLGMAEVACNGYNTRLNSKCPINGLPVGPISNPGLESIKAALYPSTTNAMFFVADCKGNVYLTNTYEEHNNTIRKLIREGNWCDN